MPTRSILQEFRLILVVTMALAFGGTAMAATQRTEKHFAVTGRPVVVIQNVANGRIEVKSSKNPEVDVVLNQTSNKIRFDMEQVGDRIDVTANLADATAQGMELETSLQLT